MEVASRSAIPWARRVRGWCLRRCRNFAGGAQEEHSSHCVLAAGRGARSGSKLRDGDHEQFFRKLHECTGAAAPPPRGFGSMRRSGRPPSLQGARAGSPGPPPLPGILVLGGRARRVPMKAIRRNSSHAPTETKTPGYAASSFAGCHAGQTHRRSPFRAEEKGTRGDAGQPGKKLPTS